MIVKAPHPIETFWMVFNLTLRSPTKVIHYVQGSARDEAERLARNNPGQTFVVLRAAYAFCTADVPLQIFDCEVSPDCEEVTRK